ncbi:hypothetical protein YC2023_008441 [Brassica napus]
MLMIDSEGTVAQGFIDVVGHLKLVDGHPLHQRPVLCTKDDSASRKVMMHLQLKDGPVINVYLWDEAAENFRVKFDACADTPTVLLVTTVNPKRLGGKLCLSSMSSSRVFLDEEVDPTKEYLTWLVFYITLPLITRTQLHSIWKQNHNVLNRYSASNFNLNTSLDSLPYQTSTASTEILLLSSQLRLRSLKRKTPTAPSGKKSYPITRLYPSSQKRISFTWLQQYHPSYPVPVN